MLTTLKMGATRSPRRSPAVAEMLLRGKNGVTRRTLADASGSKRRAAFEKAKGQPQTPAKKGPSGPPRPDFLKAATSTMQPGYGWGGKSLASASMTEKKVADRSAVLGEDFRAGAKDALEKVRRGFSELQADNPSLQLNSPSDWEIEVHLADTDNRFLVQIDFDKNELIFVSPESGGRTYFLDAESGRWRDRTDGHGFDGLLTRDVMRHCYGVPNFML